MCIIIRCIIYIYIYIYIYIHGEPLVEHYLSNGGCSSNLMNSVANDGDPWHEETHIKQTRPY